MWRKRNRMKKRKKHYEGRNRHHLVPLSRNGSNHLQNLLLIDMEKHEAWHKLWGTKTIEEVLRLLARVAQAKRHQSNRMVA